MSQDSSNPPFSRRFVYLVVFAIVTAVLLSASLWVLNFVYSRTAVSEASEAAPSDIFVNYSAAPTDYVTSESLIAMATYIGANPQPKNVQVLTGISTAEIASFMYSQVAPSLQVDCTYCHNIQDFSADTWDDTEAMARRVTARAHLQMTADLNQNWLTKLATVTEEKRPAGLQIACATCHFGEPKPVAWAANLQALPDDFRLPLDDLNVLLVNAREDISLDTVQNNQHTMYHMGSSLGVGCTHCHNSRYFPSWEQPNKYYALTMLEMTQHIRNTYKDVMNNQDPSCTLCHRNNILPPGAALSAAVLPAPLTAQTLPQAVSQK